MDTLPTTVTLNIFERINRWIQESIMVKLFSIGFLILVLLLPSHLIEEMIYEREQRADNVIDEVSDKWSGPQTVYGPLLVIPYRWVETIDVGKDGNTTKEIVEHVGKAFFLPEQLKIDGKVSPEVRSRGIFDVSVYNSDMKINSTFAKPNFKSLAVADDMVLWDQAYLVFGLSDLRGISDNPVFSVGGVSLPAEPSDNIGVYHRSTRRSADSERYVPDNEEDGSKTLGITAKLNWTSAESFKGDVDIKLHLKGSSHLDFLPVGKTTDVTLSSTWKDPSFEGEFLPEPREITKDGFTATWKVLHFNRPFAQQWKGADQQLKGGSFGVKLLIPVDQYQKSMRTSKYSVLIILLTFVALFLVEITQKIRIHPFQYILIGSALIIYYTLLLSFSEHIGYNLAYGVSSVLTVVLITLYSTSFLQSRKLSVLLALVLAIFYTFICVIILQQDFSLLLGSLGLFCIVGVLMYFSRNVNWYKKTAA
jgi:inner membrane protein